MTRTRSIVLTAVAGGLFAGLVALPVFSYAAPPYFPLSESFTALQQISDNITGDTKVAGLNGYSKKFREFLLAKGYATWKADKGWRTTANMEIHITGGTKEAPVVSVVHPDKSPTHGLVKIFYSPGIYEWLKAGKTGAIGDGEMIIKAQVGPPKGAMVIAKNLLAVDAFAGSTKEYLLSSEGFILDKLQVGPKLVNIAADFEIHGYPSMVKFKDGSHDGWFWGDWGAEPSFHEGRSASTQASGDDRMPATPGENWDNMTYGPIAGKAGCKTGASAGHHCSPSYPTGDFYGSVTMLADGFGAYCLNCHSSALKETTFADLANIEPSTEHKPLNVTVKIIDKRPTSPTTTVATVAIAEHGSHSDDRTDDPKQHLYTKLAPNPAPNPEFIARFPFFGAGVPWLDVWKGRFPARTYDHILAKSGVSRKNTAKFLTSDQCVGCHSAAGTTGNPRANMQVPHATNKALDVDISPYGEWQTSLMGLAGRDPVFFTQVQSENQRFGDAVGGKIFDTCMKCHGAMGKRLWDADKPNTLMGRAVVDAFPYSTPENAKYGSGAREGISCLICHTMEKDPGIATDEKNVSFFKGTSTFESSAADKLYGPYRATGEKLLKKPMENGLGITPEYGEHIKSSQLCGSCHVVRLPVLGGTPQAVEFVKKSTEGLPVAATKESPGKDVDGNDVSESRSDGLGYGMRHYEQTTFFEWENSDYRDGGGNPKSCQGCHMPKTYNNAPISTKIANIQDDLAADVHGRLPIEEITLPTRSSFSRHSLNGLNVFVVEMFQQFPLILGTMQANYQNLGPVQGPFLTARERVVEFAQQETADVSITGVKKSPTAVEATVKITNKAGHYFPTGVALRRAFVEFVVLDEKGDVLWGSGRTNGVGELIDGTKTPLQAELHDKDPLPHYQEITAENQAQVYEEVVKNPAGAYTYSFLGIWKSVKDNRIRPAGFKTAGYEIKAKEARYNGNAHLESHGTTGDLDYNPASATTPLTGADTIVYKAALPTGVIAKAKTVRATVYYQSFSPRYLRDVFTAGKALGEGKNEDIRRLYFLISHLNTGTSTGGTETSPITDWKLKIKSADAPIP